MNIIFVYFPSDFGVMTWMSSTDSTDSDYTWRDRQGFGTTVEINNLQSTNGVLRNSNSITVNFESG